MHIESLWVHDFIFVLEFAIYKNYDKCVTQLGRKNDFGTKSWTYVFGHHGR
jgi:hypothetical protein